MFFLFFADFFVAAISLIYRTGQDLMAPAERLPPNASRGAARAGMGIGIVLLGGLIFAGVAAFVDEARPKGEYGRINGVPISRADYEACGGKIPEGYAEFILLRQAVIAESSRSVLFCETGA